MYEFPWFSKVVFWVGVMGGGGAAAPSVSYAYENDPNITQTKN
jgi:hypothetical protein